MWVVVAWLASCGSLVFKAFLVAHVDGCKRRFLIRIIRRRAIILNLNFTADRPNHYWVTDITAINTDEGTLYLAAIEDLFSRKVVAWAIETHMETSLVTRA